MPRYKFIEVETRGGKSSNPTSSVRSHAIRAGLRRSVNPQRTRGAVQSILSTEHRGDLISLEVKAAKHKSPDPHLVVDIPIGNSIRPPTYHVESVCAGRVDPFNCFPIPTNLETDHLVKYLIIKFNISSATTDRSKSWFPYALQSAPMMHSTLAMTAALWRVEYPVLEHSIQIEGIRQKGEAMRLIRARLELVDLSSIVDSKEFTFIMSTISTLVIAEVVDGDFEAAEMHLQGVYKLFGLRGDHDSFRDEWVFRKSISLADIQLAVALGRQLIFPPLHLDHAYLPATVTDHAQHPPLDCSITSGSSYERVEIFTRLRQLLLARQSLTVSPENQLILLNVVDELILQYLYRDCVDDVSDSRRRSCSLVLAAHVFMYVTLRRVPPRSPLIRRICMRLQGTVGIAPTAGQTWTENQAALLWIAFVGLLGTGEGEWAETCPTGQSFLHLFRSVIRAYPRDLHLGVGNLRGILSAFLWDESYCQPLLAWLEHRQLTGQK
ncbi:hypothetical protein F4781DRAFT_425926 [Annulohypoxylon bovei var. microspora]|nr:hypothetical protein F4781DRAFT_425926 [Annulohypoxylon bovei var. microspora]